MSPPAIDLWLALFPLEPFLRAHFTTVFVAIPQPIRDNFMADPLFSVCDYQPTDAGAEIPIGPPGKHPARCVALSRNLRHRPPRFIQWVIAHELAHAHLFNAGRFDGEDPEHAADSLAADWGFPKPPPRNAQS